MKRMLLLVILWGLVSTVVVSPVPAVVPAYFWSQSFGSTADDHSWSVAVDGSGNVLLAGWFVGTVNFGGGNLVSAGGRDIFLAKYSANGVHQWSKRFGSTSDDYGFSVTTDVSGNVLLTGYFYGTVNFGGGNLVSAGSADVFLAKYSATGVHEWSRRFGSTSADWGHSVAVDELRNIVITGNFSGTVDFGGGGLVSAGSTDVFLAEYTTGGGYLWSRRFGGAGTDYGNAVAVDALENVLLTGYFDGTSNFGGGNLVSAGQIDIFVAKYNAAGAHQWSQRFGGTDAEQAYSLAVDGSGNVIVAGWFNGVVDFGGGGLMSAGASDIFLAAYNTNGAHRWSRRIGGTSGDIGYAIAADGAGDVIVTGHFQYIVDFGGGSLVSAGSSDVFLARYNASGGYQWSWRFGSTNSETGRAVAVDAWGNVLLAGHFGGTSNFGGGSLTSAGASDIFVAKYGGNPAEPVVQSIGDINNDQGRRVRIQFGRSGYDAGTSPIPVTAYEVYRRDDPLPASLLQVAPTPESLPRLLDDGWVYAGQVVAHGLPDYLIDAPTDADSSMALGQHYSAFFVRAATTDPLTYFDSPPDSGYSLDNLAPGAPGGFAYAAGTLTWKESTAADFDYFTVYGAAAQSFGSATVVDYCVAPTMDVTSAGYVFYFVTATDFSGNEGKPAMINTLSGVGGTPKDYVLSISSYPNPFNPSTTVRYTLPSRGRVTVAIYAARGARVATLVDADKDAGAYTERWDGRDGAGRAVSSGVYFARVDHPMGTKAYKLVLLR